MIAAAYRVLRRRLPVETRPGYCLAFVRQVIEHGLRLAPYTLYRLVEAHFALRPGEVLGQDIHPRWARGAERALRAAGLARPQVARMEPGDLVFSHRVSRPYGHVGLLMPGGLVLENTTANRGWRHPAMGAVRLTDRRDWDPITTVIDGERLAEALLALTEEAA